MSEYDNLIRQSFGTANPALPQVVGNIDENPDNAARSLELAKLSGVPSSAIYGDLDEFERTNKAQIASSIVQGNPHLSDWVQADPLHPVIANDDYGNLDTVSHKTSLLDLPMKVLRAPEALGNILFPGDPLHRIKEGGPLGSWIPEEDQRDHPFASAVAAGLGTPIELLLRGLQGGQNTAADMAANLAGAVGQESLGRELGAMVQSAGMTGRPHDYLAPSIAEHNARIARETDYASVKLWLENGREPPPSILPEYDTFRAERNARDVESLAEVVTDAQQSLVRDRNPDLFRDFIARHTDAEIGISGDVVAALYGDKRPLPDDGLLGWVPNIEQQLELAKRSGDDITIPLADWVAKVDPEMMKALSEDIRMRPGAITAREMQLSKEMDAERQALQEQAIANDPVLANAGKFQSIVKDIDSTWEENRMHGNANLFPDEIKLLQDAGFDVGNDGAMTKSTLIRMRTEAERARKGIPKGPQPPPIPLPEEVPTIRGAAGLEPLFSIGDRKVALQRMDKGYKNAAQLAEANGLKWDELSPEDRRYYETQEQSIKQADRFGPEQGFHDFNLMDEKGNVIGALNISTQQGGKVLYVDNIFGVNGLGPRDFGPALMRDLLRQIKQEFPEATAIKGHRVSGAREAAGKEMLMPEAVVKLDVPKGWDSVEVFNEWRQVLEGGQWETFSRKTQAYIKPNELRSVDNQQMAQAVNEEINRLVPKKLTLGTAVERIETKGAEGVGDVPIEPSGVYIRYPQIYPVILASLEGPDPLGSARHEAIHHLRNYGFFDKAEWATLETASNAEGWIAKHRINERYPEGNHALKLEESIAEEFTAWKRGQQVAPEVHTLFERLKQLFDSIKERISQLLGKEATWEDIFKKVDTGEVGQREGTKPIDARAFNERANVTPLVKQDNAYSRENKILEDYSTGRKMSTEEAAEAQNILMRRKLTLDDVKRGAHILQDSGHKGSLLDERLQVEDKPPTDPSRVFERANALGMSIDQYKRYEKLIEKRHLEDIEKTTQRATDAQKRVQTKQWKDDRNVLRQTVADEINLRPDIAADNYFADGMLYGEKVERIKLGTDFLSDAQKASLPRDYYNKAGAHPDDLAGLFGYPDGASLVTHLAGLSETRRLSGMRPIEFKRRMIDIETDRQMLMKYGVLENNIIDAVKEQVASETQLNLLHEETLYYGMKSGQEPAFDQQAVKRFVADEFEASKSSTVSSDRYLATAGRAGKAVENFLLKQDFEGAFREKQRQYYATLLAKEAVQFEAQTAKFEKLTAKLVKREVKAVEPEYLDFIHGLLGEATVPIKRSMEEIARSKESYGHPDMASFVAAKNLEGWDLAVSEELQKGPSKPLDQMTVGESREFMDAVTSLNHVGRAVRKIEIAGEKADFVDFRNEVIQNIQQLPARTRESQGRWLYKIDASLTRMEEIAKDLDLRKELGPLHQAVIEPMMRSKAKEFDLMTDLSKHFQETRGTFDGKWRKSLDDTITQDILHDPYTDAPYDMTRQNLIQVMLNWGNRSNIGKFVQGAAVAKFGRRLTREEFPQFEAEIKGLIDKHATAEDWAFVRRMWEPFKGWQGQMETVSRNTSGVVPKMVEIGNVETPHGTFEGGYWPVKYDRLGSNISTIEDRPTRDGVFGGDYFRAATAKGYLKERTGYVDFVDISTSLEQAAGTMQQTIHDIAFRDSLIQAGRVFYDKGIRTAIRKHYGSEYEAQLVPWLRRIAHQFSTDDSSIAGYNDFMRRVRINLVGHALPLNLKVILSPDIGVPNPSAWASYLANRGENVKLAMEKSDEIRHLVYNMDRDFRESLDRVTLDPTVGDLQKKAVQWGFVPIAKVSQEFRISTFVDQYNKALGRGKTEAEAALIADSFVRERHGAASVVDLPAVMQSNEGMKMLTMFYGYFNTMYNWQRQLPGNVRRGEGKEFMVNGLGSVVVGAAFGAALFNQRKQDDSWFKIMAKALLLQPLSTIPVVNTAASYFAEGYAPRTPIASLLGAAGSIITDTRKLAKGERIDKPIQHISNVVGLSTGLPLAQVGRTTQFGVDVARGRQRPKNIADWARGIITGEAKLKH